MKNRHFFRIQCQSLTVNKLADVAADPDDELHVAMETGTAVEVGQTVT